MRHHHHSDHDRGFRGHFHHMGQDMGPDARHGMGHHRGRHEGRHGRGVRGRFFDQGDLRLVILSLIAEQPRHGYELIKEIEDRLGGAYAPSPGVVYPTLTLLEDLGYAELQVGEGPKKLYAATDEGRAFLEQNKASVDAITERMTEAAPDRLLAPRITRGMANLKMALRLRLSQGGLTGEQIDQIAAALDAAARDIERV
jgi:DNA-binding PadR family transcriptional regulator